MWIEGEETKILANVFTDGKVQDREIFGLIASSLNREGAELGVLTRKQMSRFTSATDEFFIIYDKKLWKF